MNVPYTNGRGYVPLLKLMGDKELKINKAIVRIYGSSILIDERAANGVIVVRDGFVFLGEHYTGREEASSIINNRFFAPGSDGFAYFLEPDIGITDKNFLKKMLGVGRADALIKIKTGAIDFSRIWIKTEKNFPYLKIAVEGGLMFDEIAGPINYSRV